MLVFSHAISAALAWEFFEIVENLFGSHYTLSSSGDTNTASRSFFPMQCSRREGLIFMRGDHSDANITRTIGAAFLSHKTKPATLQYLHNLIEMSSIKPSTTDVAMRWSQYMNAPWSLPKLFSVFLFFHKLISANNESDMYISDGELFFVQMSFSHAIHTDEKQRFSSRNRSYLLMSVKSMIVCMVSINY